MALQKFSEVSKDGCCPKCGYAIMKRPTGNIAGRAVGVAMLVATTGAIGGVPRKKISCGGCGTKFLQG